MIPLLLSSLLLSPGFIMLTFKSAEFLEDCRLLLPLLLRGVRLCYIVAFKAYSFGLRFSGVSLRLAWRALFRFYWLGLLKGGSGLLRCQHKQENDRSQRAKTNFENTADLIVGRHRIAGCDDYYDITSERFCLRTYLISMQLQHLQVQSH